MDEMNLDGARIAVERGQASSGPPKAVRSPSPMMGRRNQLRWRLERWPGGRGAPQVAAIFQFCPQKHGKKTSRCQSFPGPLATVQRDQATQMGGPAYGALFARIVVGPDEPGTAHQQLRRLLLSSVPFFFLLFFLFETNLPYLLRTPPWWSSKRWGLSSPCPASAGSMGTKLL